MISDCQFLSEIQHKTSYIFHKTIICIKMFSYLKTYLKCIQSSRFSYLLLKIKNQFPDGDTSLSFQVRGWIYQWNIYFLMVTITFILSIQNSIKKYCIWTKSSQTFFVCKNNYFLSVITITFGYIPYLQIIPHFLVNTKKNFRIR